MQPLHKRLPSNTTGRDFIVGDLIDRGPNSLACLRLLKEPWFHVVRGNHEIMLLDYAYPGMKSGSLLQNNDLFLWNGGRWVQKLDEAEQTKLRYELLPRVAAMPFVISVGNGPDRYHVVHSELMTGDPELSARFFAQQNIHEKPVPDRILTDADLDSCPEDVLGSMRDAMVWGRQIFKAAKPGQAQAIDSPAGFW